MRSQPKQRARQGARKSYKYESVPDTLIGVCLILPEGCDIRDLEWAEPSGPGFEQERNREALRVLALPEAAQRAWLAEQQDRSDAAMSGPGPFSKIGGAQ